MVRKQKPNGDEDNYCTIFMFVFAKSIFFIVKSEESNSVFILENGVYYWAKVRK